MKLQYLKASDTCPICGSITIQEGFDSYRYTEEYRIYSCGHKVRYDEVRRRTITVAECPETPEIKDKISKRFKAYEKIGSYLNKLDIDQHFKEVILREIREIIYD